MSNIELLDNVKHHDLKVDSGYSAEYGDSVNQVLVFPTEFIELQKEYPILLKKDKESGQFQAVALLGLEKDENLFLDEKGWHAHYVPAIQARGPFSIGLRKEGQGADERVEPLVQVDMDSPRIHAGGTSVFLEHGGSTDYLKRISEVLKAIQDGWAVANTLYPFLDQLGLIEPININVNISYSERYRIENYYTVSEEKLLELDANQLKELNNVGYLQAAYHIISSQTNISRLVEQKNRKREAA